MSRMWRIVLYAAATLLGLGLVLLGAAWLTGASFARVAELVFGGKVELAAWFRAGLDQALALLNSLAARILAIF